MTKEAYYFSHDSNARHDPKITVMRSAYGSEGYGWFWIIIEMLRESNEYKLSMQGKYVWNAFALQMHCDNDAAKNFINDCISEFELFESDGMFFWSNSLVERMKKRDEKSEKARASANSRWNKSEGNADAMRTHSEGNALKERKGKERKEKDIRDIVSHKDESAIHFETFWDSYPTKGSNKKMSLTKWTALWKADKIDMEQMLKGVTDYVSHQEKKGYDICAAQVFLNQERWKDDWSISSAKGTKSKNEGLKYWETPL